MYKDIEYHTDSVQHLLNTLTLLLSYTAAECKKVDEASNALKQ